MRVKFPGHFRLEETEIKKVWKTSLLVFDANVLLNFYRYSDSTRRDFLGLLRKFQSRIWLPHQACKEFLTNRLTTISEQEREYADAASDLDKIQAKFKNDRRHPFLPAELEDRVSKIFGELKSHLNTEKNRFGGLISADPILEEIEDLFAAHVGDQPKEEVLTAVFKSGAERYKKRIPPGFKDSTKSDEAGDEKRYGDLVLWMEMIWKAKAEKRGMVFVTDDRKEDWWLMSGSKTVGPRPELLAEFLAESGQQVLFYQPHRFLEYAKPFLGEEVSAAAIAETRVRKEPAATASAEKLSSSAWLEKNRSLDRRMAGLLREIQMEESKLEVDRDIAQLIGTELQDQSYIHLSEHKILALRKELAEVQAERKALLIP